MQVDFYKHPFHSVIYLTPAEDCFFLSLASAIPNQLERLQTLAPVHDITYGNILVIATY